MDLWCTKVTDAGLGHLTGLSRLNFGLSTMDKRHERWN